MKVSSINKLLKYTENNTATINNDGELIFDYLLKTYEILSEIHKDKHSYDTYSYTILLNSGGKRDLYCSTRTNKRSSSSMTYKIGPALNM